MAPRDYKYSLDDDATIPSVFDPRIFGDNSATPDNWNFNLAGIEPRVPFPADAVGILYPMATIDAGDYWINGDGNVDCRIGGGRINTFCSTEIV